MPQLLDADPQTPSLGATSASRINASGWPSWKSSGTIIKLSETQCSACGPKRMTSSSDSVKSSKTLHRTWPLNIKRRRKLPCSRSITAWEPGNGKQAKHQACRLLALPRGLACSPLPDFRPRHPGNLLRGLASLCCRNKA